MISHVIRVWSGTGSVRDEPGEYDTIAGFLMDQLGRIPGDDESPEVTYQNYRFTINEVDERRIKGVIIEKLPVEENSLEK